MRIRKRLVATGGMLLAAVIFASPLAGQEATPEMPAGAVADDAAEEAPSLDDLWGNFIHYIKIARPEIARSHGEAILRSDADPREVYLLSAKTADVQSVLRRGERLEGLGEVVNQIRELIEAGYEAQRSSPEQIAESIEMLGGTLRGYELAKKRLQASGEYAMPQLVQRLMDPDTSNTLRERIVTLLPDMGRVAVRPLSVALQSGDEELLSILANALGRIEYSFAAPRLKELAERKDILPQTRRIAQAALINCAGRAALDKSAAELFFDVAGKYYYRADSLLPPEDSPQANVWYWVDGLGVTYKPVAREIFCDVYAMRMSRLALQHDDEFYPAIPLWVSANLNRAANLPEGETDPTRQPGEPGAEFYALASSARFLQEALGRALRDENYPVAIGLIEALSKTAGTENLVEPIGGGAQPLVQALGSPDRHVRYRAAVTLAGALPQQRFVGYEWVMPVLAEAVRQTGRRSVLLIAPVEAQQNVLKDAIRQADYAMITETSPTAGMQAARQTAGVDLIVLGSGLEADQVLNQLRRDPTFATAPVVVAATGSRDIADAREQVIGIAADADTEQIIDALNQGELLRAGEAITPAEATMWAVRAADAIYRLGLTDTPVYRIARTMPTLIVALDDERAEVRLGAAEALSVMIEADAQQAIAALATNAEAPNEVRVEAFGHLSASLRRFGRQLTDSQARAVLRVVTGDQPQPVRVAAAQALGAMSLPSEQTADLFVQTTNGE